MLRWTIEKKSFFQNVLVLSIDTTIYEESAASMLPSSCTLKNQAVRLFIKAHTCLPNCMGSYTRHRSIILIHVCFDLTFIKFYKVPAIYRIKEHFCRSLSFKVPSDYFPRGNEERKFSFMIGGKSVEFESAVSYMIQVLERYIN